MNVLAKLTRGVGGECEPTPHRALTFEENLKDEKARLEKRLANINAVLESLKKNPQIAKVLESINRLGY